MGEEARAERRISIEQVIAYVFEQLRRLARDAAEQAAALMAGERLAREVAAFHRGLLEGGVPEDLARRLTERYLELYAKTVNPSEIVAALLGSSGPRARTAPAPEALQAAATALKALRGGGEPQA